MVHKLYINIFHNVPCQVSDVGTFFNFEAQVNLKARYEKVLSLIRILVFVANITQTNIFYFIFRFMENIGDFENTFICWINACFLLSNLYHTQSQIFGGSSIIMLGFCGVFRCYGGVIFHNIIV